MELPPIVSREEWQQSHEALLAKEKEATRARDALAAERRRQPMTEFSPDYRFEGPDGVVTLAELFEGRSQLIVYHFWFPPGGIRAGAARCSPTRSARSTTSTRATPRSRSSRRRPGRDRAVKRRMGWTIPWYTVVGRVPGGVRDEEYFALDVFLREGDRAFLTYARTAAGSRPSAAPGRSST